VSDPNDLPLSSLLDRLAPPGDRRRLLEAALAEDLGMHGDVTSRSLIGPDETMEAAIVSRSAGVVAGLPVAAELVGLEAFELSIDLDRADGDAVESGDVLARLRGRRLDLLAVERTLLNLLGRLCGVATMGRRFVAAATAGAESAGLGTTPAVCGTRKTTPGLRGLEKYAGRCGGVTLHRLGLFDAALYKDNHLAGIDPGDLPARLAEAIGRARDGSDLRFVEIEVDGEDQLRAVLGMDAGLVDVVLLDNFDTDRLRSAAALRDQLAPGVLLEASGGVTLETIGDIATTGVDRISSGSITHAAPSLDLGLDAV